MACALTRAGKIIFGVFLWLVFWIGILFALLGILPLILFMVFLVSPSKFLGFGFGFPFAHWIYGPWLLATAAIGWFYTFKGRFKVLWLLIAGLGVLEIVFAPRLS